MEDKWSSDCKYVAEYVSGGKIKSKEQEAFYHNSITKFEILEVNKPYYVFAGTINTQKGVRMYKDTTWLHEK